MMCQKYVGYIDTVYGPDDIDSKFYDEVLEVYQELMVHSNMEIAINYLIGEQTVLSYDKIEETIFKRIVHWIHRDVCRSMEHDARFNMDYHFKIEVLDSTVNEFVENHSTRISKDIKTCLKHAQLCYVDSEFITEAGNVEIIRNSPQVKLFDDYDIYGYSDR